jgi:hypothetical protein
MDELLAGIVLDPRMAPLKAGIDTGLFLWQLNNSLLLTLRCLSVSGGVVKTMGMIRSLPQPTES